jgi:phenylacetate-coenzyme A ligase PaaK-like adenylate-forming protein
LHRERALADLRAYAGEHSRFYRRFHAGYESRPLAELPVLTKGQLMESFDEVVTDPAVLLEDVRGFLAALDGYRLFKGRYWVARTSGSTGSPGIFLWNRDEWTAVIASYARAQEWAGIKVDLLRWKRLGVVSSRIPWHQSALVGMSVDSAIVPVRRFDATAPIAEIVAALNEWRPENLICYASMGRLLAEEQLSGRLKIQPSAVMCSSEVLTSESRGRIRRAFGVEPFNVYATTETAGVASECEQHRLHLFDDLVITEVVDDRNRPVPAGVVGAKVLVTVLFSRTQPLIRYEMSDTISLLPSRCDCGRELGLIASIEGRTEDVLTLPAAGATTVSIHPNLFHQVLEPLPVKQWQLEQTDHALVVRIVPGEAPVVAERIVSALADALAEGGALPVPIDVRWVDAVVKTPLGKAPLIKALRRGDSP